MRGIGHETIAHAERALGRLDQAVGEFNAFRVAHAKPLVERKDDQRSQPLGRRRRVVDRADAELHAQRIGDPRLIALQILARHGTADLFQVGRDLLPHIAAIEIVESGFEEMSERVRERRLLERAARLGRLAVGKEDIREARHVLQFGQLLRGQPRLAARHDIAVARIADRGMQQHVERQFPAADRARRVQRNHPAPDRARHRERGKRPARRNVFVFAVKLRLCARPGRTRRHDRAHALVRLAHQPEAVAADVVHVRIDRRNRGRHRHHRFEGVAALANHRAAGFGGGMMWRGGDAAPVSGGVQFSHARPRRRSRAASATHSRPATGRGTRDKAPPGRANRRSTARTASAWPRPTD